MPKFKVGDRVVLSRPDEGSDTNAGQIGTVAESSDFPWVNFDEPTRYVLGEWYEGSTIASLGIPDGHADCMADHRLDYFIEKKPKTIPNIQSFALRVIESGLLDAEACKVVASFALEFTGDDDV